MWHSPINRDIIIKLILLLTEIFCSEAKQPTATHYNGNFTAIDLIEMLRHSQSSYESILVMKNQNATISSIFYTYLSNEVEHKRYNNVNISEISKQKFGALSETASMTFAKKLMVRLQMPVLQMNELQNFYLKRHYNEKFLSIVYIEIDFAGMQVTFNNHRSLLEKFSRNLLHITAPKVMFLINFPTAVENDVSASAAALKSKIDKDIIQSILVELFRHCWQQKIINVVAILADNQLTNTFYSYTPFPEFQLEAKQIAVNSAQQEEIYPQRLRDLKGYKLPIVISGTTARIITYTTPKGKKVIGGFVGHFIETFAKNYNTTLVQPLPFNPDKPIPSKDLVQTVRNGTAEISFGILSPGLTLTGFAYPIELLNWCVMLPIEQNIPAYKFFTLVFKGQTFTLLFLVMLLISIVLFVALHIHGYHAQFFDIVSRGDYLRGTLAQPFSELKNPPKIVRFIYLKICIFGILVTTSYTSHLATYVTQAPKEPTIKSYDDILRSRLKIVIWQPEYISMGVVKNYKQYAGMFHLVHDYQEFLKLRDSFNTNYGYIVPTTKWGIIQKRQQLLAKPLFRISHKLCFATNNPMSFTVHENSLYTPLLNRLILETSQFGLLEFWLNYASLEQAMAKELKHDDLSAPRKFKAMAFDDLRYIIVFVACMYLLVFLVFLSELLVFSREKINRHFYYILRKIK